MKAAQRARLEKEKVAESQASQENPERVDPQALNRVNPERVDPRALNRVNLERAEAQRIARNLEKEETEKAVPPQAPSLDQVARVVKAKDPVESVNQVKAAKARDQAPARAMIANTQRGHPNHRKRHQREMEKAKEEVLKERVVKEEAQRIQRRCQPPSPERERAAREEAPNLEKAEKVVKEEKAAKAQVLARKEDAIPRNQLPAAQRIRKRCRHPNLERAARAVLLAPSLERVVRAQVLLAQKDEIQRSKPRKVQRVLRSYQIQNQERARVVLQAPSPERAVKALVKEVRAQQGVQR